MVDFRAEIESKLDLLQQRLRSFEEVQRSLTELSGTGSGADGQVEAVVGPTGALKSLAIQPRALRLGSEKLAEEIMAAANKAAENVTTRANELLEPLTGAQSNLGDLMIGKTSLDSERLSEVVGAQKIDPAQQIEEILEKARRKMYGHS